MRRNVIVRGYVLLSLLFPVVAVADDWPQFRGGTAQGVAAAARVPAQWSNADHLAWRTAIPGAGWSQPIVAGGRIFVTTAVDPKAD
ncbi:MAG: PQQ-binding-like beta-propeller repeat protein, partial [Planctomycetia bacterium]